MLSRVQNITNLRIRAVQEDAALRLALAHRIDACWERLDDIVDELVSVHGVSAASIAERAIVVALIARAEE